MDCSSPATFPLLADDILREVYSVHLGVHDWLVCAQVCQAFLAATDDQLRNRELRLSGDHITDRFLTFFLRRLPDERSLRVLDLSDCNELSRAGVARALLFGKCGSLETLHALGVGGASWTAEELRRLVDAAPPSLRVLHADCRVKRTDDIHALISDEDAALKPRKLEVDASTALLDERGVRELAAAADSGLRTLRLPGAGALAAPGRVQALSTALARSERLEHLALGCSSITAAGARELASGLRRNRSLQQLELQHNPLLDAGVTALGTALKVHPRLKCLSLPFTGIGDVACGSLASAMRAGPCLETLDLAGNLLTASGATELAASLPCARKLTTLVLSANPKVGARGAAALAAAITQCGALRTLRLDGCALGKAPCGRLAAALTRTTSLQSLDLSSNELGDEGAWELAWRLPECTTLRELRLACNEIEEDGASELLAGLNGAPALLLLDLRGNRLEATGATHAALEATGRANLAFQRAPAWRTAAPEVA